MSVVQQQLIVGGEEEGIGRHGRASKSAPDSLPGQWPVGGNGGEDCGNVGRVNEVADEVAMQRKETMSRIDGRVVGHGMWCGSDQAGGRPLQGGGPLNSLDLVTIGASGEEQVSRGKSECVYEKEVQRMVAEVKEGVEQMAADLSLIHI